MFKPTYKVIIPRGTDGKADRSAGLRMVIHNGISHHVLKFNNGVYAVHYDDGTISGRFPTLRDCVFAIITR